jgi:hypothetical protein
LRWKKEKSGIDSGNVFISTASESKVGVAGLAVGGVGGFKIAADGLLVM